MKVKQLYTLYTEKLFKGKALC